MLEPVTADAGADQLDICGSVTQLSAVAPAAGTGTWSIASGAGGSFANANSATTAFTGQPGQSYSLIWTVNQAPCASSSSAPITVSFQQLVLSPSVQGDTVCGSGPATLTASGAPMGTGVYEWYTDTTQAPVSTGSIFNTPSISATTTFYVAISNGDCRSGFVPVQAIVEALPPIDAGLSVTITQGQSTLLMASGGTTYSWSPAATLSSANSPMPTATPTATTVYTVSTETALGCPATDTVTVRVIPILQIPNGFTPNGDGQNDVWEIAALTEAYPGCQIEVFNRWGGQVFKSTGYQTPWDGRHQGAPLPTATYYYVIYLQKGTAPLSGSVTIIR